MNKVAIGRVVLTTLQRTQQHAGIQNRSPPLRKRRRPRRSFLDDRAAVLASKESFKPVFVGLAQQSLEHLQFLVDHAHVAAHLGGDVA